MNDRDFYHNNGYLVLKSFFKKDLIKEIDKKLCHLDYDIINNKKEDVANKN